MKTNYVLLPLLFLLLAAGALATPTVTVDQTVMICEGHACNNASMVKQGLEHIPPTFTKTLQYIDVYDSLPPTVNGTLLIADRSRGGLLVLRVKGVNTTSYRRVVAASLQAYYEQGMVRQGVADQQKTARQEAQSFLRYPLPSWMPLPGQCSMGVRMQNSRGQSVCVRPHR